MGGPGEEFRIDFHSALNLQREGGREGERLREGGGCSLDVVVQKELLSQKPLLVQNVSGFSIDGGAPRARRSGRGRGSLRLFKADVAAHRPLQSFKCV